VIRVALLVVTLAVCPGVRAEEASTTTTTAPAEAARPAIEYAPDTPRGAMARFFAAARSGQYARAAEYLNLRALPPSERARRGPELTRELETVLDRVLWVDVEKLSADAGGDPNDGLPGFRDSLGTIETSTGPVEILIERVPQPGGAPVWKIASTTVAMIAALYEEFGWGPLATYLPAPFFEIRFLQVRLWQWIGLVLLATLAWLASRLLRPVLVRIAHRALVRAGRPDGVNAEHAAEPLRLGIALAVFATGVPWLALAVPVNRIVVGAEKALAIIVLTWLVLRSLDVLTAPLERRFARRHAAATVPFGRRALKVFIAVMAFIAALQNFGFNVTGLLAGLGIGGLAVALAAQKTVENLFGSLSLVADQPVRVGDVCRFGETVGRVEDIGLRSTRLRTIDRTLVTIPNAQFSTLALENLTRRDRIPVRARFTLPQGTNAARVREVLEKLRARTAEQPKVEASSVRIRFVKLEPQALEIELFAYVLTSVWDEFVDVRQQVFLAALEVMGGAGALE
jgi:MscS family membrane protein